MAVIRITIDGTKVNRGAQVEYFNDASQDGVEGVLANKVPLTGLYMVSIQAVKGHIDRMITQPRRNAAANNQVGTERMNGPIIRPNRETMMITSPTRVRMATRFASKKMTLGVATGEVNVKPREITLPSRWWICDYDPKSGNMLYYGLAIEVNERNPIDPLAHGVDPMVAEWVYGNCDPGGRVCWGQSAVHINQQPAAEIDSLFFGTPFNNHLHYRAWPKDGDIPRDMDVMQAPRLSAVLKGEAQIVPPTQRQQQQAANVTGTQQAGNIGGIQGIFVEADGTIRPA